MKTLFILSLLALFLGAVLEDLTVLVKTAEFFETVGGVGIVLILLAVIFGEEKTK